MQGDMLPSPDPHQQPEAIEAIQSTDAFPIDRPAFTTQQHPDSQIAKSGSGIGEIPNPYPQGGLIFGPTPSIPGGASELRQPTGPRTAHHRTSRETTGPVLDGGRALDFFS